MEINISDPRVKRRCQQALAFVMSQLSQTPKPISTRVIDRHIGYTHKPLGKQLRNLLLIESDGHYNMATGKCKQYTRNTEGCKRLQHLLDPTIQYHIAQTQHVANFVDHYQQQLTTGQFNYNDKSNRRWHPIQNIPSEQRKRELSRYGYCHIYDIRCAAPSIILHLANELGVKLKHTSTIQYYIANKTAMRQQLAHDLQLSITDTKKLINMLFNGAPVGHISHLATTQHLKGDSAAIQRVKDHGFLTALRHDITHCWSKIANHQIDGEYVIPRAYHPDGRKRRITSTDRWRVYFLFERRVMNSVTQYLDKQCAKYFIEHDGWSSNICVDINDLTEHVRTTSGIHTIEFEYEFYDRSSSAAH
jgi:hypothetical protein